MERKIIQACGCEFTELIDDETLESYLFLSRCRCERHYKEQFVAKWSDAYGDHKVIRDKSEMSNIIPLEHIKNPKCSHCGSGYVVPNMFATAKQKKGIWTCVDCGTDHEAVELLKKYGEVLK